MDKREQAICDNTGLVHSIAHRFKGKGIEYDDLYSAGCIGLIKAFDAFDESRGFKFSTYAVPVIMGEIKRLFRDGGTVKVGRALKELSLKISRFRTEYLAGYGCEPTICEVALKFGIDPCEAAEALNVAQPVLSLTISDGEGGGQWDIIEESPDEALSNSLALKQVIGSLSPGDRSLIILRYFKSQTQSKTAEALGMTQVQVSRREKVILNELRKQLTG